MHLTLNDCLVILTDLLEGGGISQVHRIKRRMQKELIASNAVALAEYDDSVAMCPTRLTEWTALPAESGGPAPALATPRRTPSQGNPV